MLFVALFGRQWNHAHDVAVLRSYVRNRLWNPFTSVVTRSYVRNRIRKRRFCVRPSIIFLGRPFAPSSLYRIARSLLLYRERTLLLIPSRNTFFFLGIRNSILSNSCIRPKLSHSKTRSLRLQVVSKGEPLSNQERNQGKNYSNIWCSGRNCQKEDVRFRGSL